MAKKPFSFAHLIGLGASASEEDDDKKSKKAKKAKSRRLEEEEEETAEEEEEEETAEEEEDEETASEEEEEDPDAEEDDGDDRKEGKAAKNARISERKRCARIFGSAHAASNPALAASLAFNTGMSSTAAINVLASSAPAAQPQATRKRSLDQRMQESHDVRLGPDGGNKTGGKSTLVNKMTSLYNSTKGEK